MSGRKERFYSGLAKILPRNLVYFATIRLVAHATQGRWGNTTVPDLTAMEALLRWNEK